MKSTTRSVPAFVLTALLAWPLAAGAGILLVEKTTVTNSPAQTHNIMIDKDAMRVEHDMASGEKATFLFDGVKQVIRIVNFEKKIYTEVTKADLDAATQQMTESMARMQEQMKSLPPDQRARMEAMMKSNMPGGGPAPKLTYRKVGTDTVGRWKCDKYDGYQNNQKMFELCTVDPSVLGFVAADFDVARKLADFFKQLRPFGGADSMFAVGRVEDQGFAGVPVRRVFSSGPQSSVTEMTQATRQTFPPSTFEVPAGFQKQPFAGRPQ